jgi:hypothetical protein
MFNVCLPGTVAKRFCVSEGILQACVSFTFYTQAVMAVGLQMWTSLHSKLKSNLTPSASLKVSDV